MFSLILTYAIKEISIKKSLVDIPNHRSSHSLPTPHGGGIAIVITWFTGISYLYYTHNINSSLYYALIAGVILSVVSYLDDLYELKKNNQIDFKIGMQIAIDDIDGMKTKIQKIPITVLRHRI